MARVSVPGGMEAPPAAYGGRGCAAPMLENVFKSASQKSRFGRESGAVTVLTAIGLIKTAI